MLVNLSLGAGGRLQIQGAIVTFSFLFLLGFVFLRLRQILRLINV